MPFVLGPDGAACVGAAVDDEVRGPARAGVGCVDGAVAGGRHLELVLGGGAADSNVAGKRPNTCWSRIRSSRCPVSLPRGATRSRPLVAKDLAGAPASVGDLVGRDAARADQVGGRAAPGNPCRVVEVDLVDGHGAADDLLGGDGAACQLVARDVAVGEHRIGDTVGGDQKRHVTAGAAAGQPAPAVTPVMSPPPLEALRQQLVREAHLERRRVVGAVGEARAEHHHLAGPRQHLDLQSQVLRVDRRAAGP